MPNKSFYLILLDKNVIFNSQKSYLITLKPFREFVVLAG